MTSATSNDKSDRNLERWLFLWGMTLKIFNFWFGLLKFLRPLVLQAIVFIALLVGLLYTLTRLSLWVTISAFAIVLFVPYLKLFYALLLAATEDEDEEYENQDPLNDWHLRIK